MAGHRTQRGFASVHALTRSSSRFPPIPKAICGACNGPMLRRHVPPDPGSAIEVGRRAVRGRVAAQGDASWLRLLAKHDPSDRLPERNRLLRMVDAWAEWQMRQSLRVIARGKADCGLVQRGPFAAPLS